MEEQMQAGGNGCLSVYHTDISREKLKKGISAPDGVNIVRETSLDEDMVNDFYSPAVALLNRIYCEKYLAS